MSARVASVLIGLSALLLLAFTPAASDLIEREPHSYIVELEAQPAAVAAAAAERAGEAFDLAAYRAELAAHQDALLADLAAAGVEVALQAVDTTVGGASVVREARLTLVLNAVVVLADPDAVAAIESDSRVRAVHPDTEMHALMGESVDYTNAPKVWELGATGAGQAVGVLDTGIDWSHPMFGGDPTPPSPLHPKVTHYETWTAGHHDAHGHGTHVAGTAAGSSEFGDTTLGEARYDAPAKDAEIWAYKVLTDEGSGLGQSTVLAIESAVERGVDVLNLSLGSPDGDPEGPSSRAVNNAAVAGVPAAVAAGNDGPGYSTIGAPAAAHDAVTVGASTDPGDFAYLASLPDVGLLDLEIIPLSGTPTPADDQQDLYVDCGLAITPAECIGADGRIALIERGEVPFAVKAANAEAAGAIAAIIYNNEPGNFAGTMILRRTEIPVVAMSQEDGHALLEHVGADGVSTTEARLAWTDAHSIVDQVAGFSSRGPNNDWVIKPDVVAPGNNITAPVPRAGQLASPEDPYWEAGGTSMAAPHVAGILAQLRELHPDWTPQMLKTALMNTAVQLVNPATGDLYSVHDQGAGLVDAYAAATTPALIGETYEGHEAFEDGELARGSVSFGLVEVEGRTILEKEIKVVNLTDERDSWRLSFEGARVHDRHEDSHDLPARGFRVQVQPQNLRVAAGGEATTTVRLVLDSRWLAAGDYEGRIVATNGTTTLRVPVAVRADVAEDPAEMDFEPTTLWFRGNVEDGCTGDGRLDLLVCDGPFLRADDDLSEAEPASWTAPSSIGGLIRGGNDRTFYDPSWAWFLDDGEEVSLEGPMTVRWWARCSACGGDFGANWLVRLWVDGEEVLEESVGAFPVELQETGLLEATVMIADEDGEPIRVTATERITLHIDPQFIDSQTVAQIFYDSRTGCGADDGPCDSHVVLPVVRD